ncbi:DUF6457 domain-containing protein [Flexivirga caeni]|uniref:DUF6457 domain-containing protein n=1 Tax=Flexivirga caeni TaxID=2294115 RepID=UPI001C65AB14|nr:DUF6457 domain-containing protein [Flexivirga caeni]
MGTLDDWLSTVQAELGIELDIPTGELLEFTKVVAHGVARPAAPLTAFLVGYAAARAGGGRAAVENVCLQTKALVAQRPRREVDDG